MAQARVEAETKAEVNEPLRLPPREVMVAGKRACTIVFGTSRYAAKKEPDGRIVPRHDKDDEERDLLRAALARGFNFFDTAAAYGDAEVILGQAIGGNSLRERAVIATKVGQHPSSEGDLLREIQDGLDRLQTTPDILMIHDRWEGCMGSEMDMALKVLLEALENGWTQAIGVSNFRPEELERAIKVCQGKLTVYQAKINFQEPRGETADLLRICRENHLIFMASSAFHRGALFKGYDNPVVGEIAKKYNMTLAQVAIFAILALGALPIVQTHSGAHMEENRKGFEMGMTESDLQKLKAVVLEKAASVR